MKTQTQTELKAAYETVKATEDAAYNARNDAEALSKNWDDLEPYAAAFVKAFDARKRAENALCGTNYNSLV